MVKFCPQCSYLCRRTAAVPVVAALLLVSLFLSALANFVHFPLTIEDLRDELCLRYERMNDRAVETDESEDDEKAMVVITKFKGKCHCCGVYGHKGADCRSSGADGGGNGGNGDGGGGGKG